MSNEFAGPLSNGEKNANWVTLRSVERERESNGERNGDERRGIKGRTTIGKLKTVQEMKREHSAGGHFPYEKQSSIYYY